MHWNFGPSFPFSFCFVFVFIFFLYFHDLISLIERERAAQRIHFEPINCSGMPATTFLKLSMFLGLFLVMWPFFLGGSIMWPFSFRFVLEPVLMRNGWTLDHENKIGWMLNSMLGSRVVQQEPSWAICQLKENSCDVLVHIWTFIPILKVHLDSITKKKNLWIWPQN